MKSGASAHSGLAAPEDGRTPIPSSPPSLTHYASAGKNLLHERVLAWQATCDGLLYSCNATRPKDSVVGEAGTKPLQAGTEHESSLMTILDLIKATVVCGAIAFLIYSYPILGQIVLIGFLSLLWLVYAHKTIANLRRR